MRNIEPGQLSTATTRYSDQQLSDDVIYADYSVVKGIY